MTELLIRLFVGKNASADDPRTRTSYGVLSGFVGIAVNVILTAAKFAVGSLTGSISITADAINNLSDAGSSVVTLVGFKMAKKPADREHPYGHGRIEYISALIVSFLVLLMGVELLKSSVEKIKAPDKKIAEKMGFSSCFSVSGQTYSRKLDSQVLFVLSGIAQSASKFSNDLRLLQHMKEIEEPFEKKQIGSSAMAYKRNPMRSERITSLSRYVMADVINPSVTAGTQWLERSLDDSANKRISIAEGFLATDAILELYINIVSGLVVYPKMIEKHLNDELPFMATENILMEAVKKGGNRQTLHEEIRRHSMAAGAVVKVEGKPNDLVERIAADPMFSLTLDEIKAQLKPENFMGRAPQQVTEFIEGDVKPVLEKYKDLLGLEVEIKV